MHCELGKEAKPLLKCSVKIRPSNPDWESRKFAGEVTFDLWSLGQREFARKGGTRVGVIALPCEDPGSPDDAQDTLEFTPRPWTTWFEQWRKRPDHSFALVNAGWTVFWGITGDDAKEQVLRAEWGPVDESEPSANDAAMPHWHVDPPLELLVDRISSSRRFKALVPVFRDIPGGPIGERLLIKRVHLGMGGWRNDSPGLWRDMTLHDPDELRTWAVRTLAYLKSQSQFFSAR